MEFTRNGGYALVSVWQDDGAVIIYYAATLEEGIRLPMRNPSGKYSVWNKITFSEGASHQCVSRRFCITLPTQHVCVANFASSVKVMP